MPNFYAADEDLPFGMDDTDQLVQDPSSPRRFEALGLDIAEQLFADMRLSSPDELILLMWSVAALARSEACDQWLNAVPGRSLKDWAIMSLDTALVWSRG